MEIIVGKTAGFCYGVKNAVERTKQELEHKKERYCLGELVHNGQVIKKLEEKGLHIIEKIEEAKAKTVIRAHGIEKTIYAEAKKLGIELLDLTCPNVLKIHKIAEKYQEEDWYIFLLGEQAHPEVVGTISFCGKNSRVIEDIEQVKPAVEELERANIKKLLVLSQTTFHLGRFEGIVEEIKKQLEHKEIQLEVKKTICNATQIRQEETNDLARQVDCMIIIGGKKSSNTNKLYEIAKKECDHTIMIETKEELLGKKLTSFQTIGIMAGASTPQDSIEEVIKLLKEDD